MLAAMQNFVVPLLCLSLVMLPRAVRGDDAANARSKYEEGTTLYDLGRYAEAAHAYEEAFRLKNDAALLFNIGQAYRLGNDYASALRAYRSFLRRVPDARNRPDVEKHIATLQALIEAQKQPTPGAEPYGPVTEPKPLPTPLPPPTLTAPTPQPVALAATPAPVHDKPIYKKWWLWTVVGVVVAGAVVGGVVAAELPKNAARPAGASAVTFP